jgi:phage shock protein PspC (stress-responsive transcriptional regulator)
MGFKANPDNTGPLVISDGTLAGIAKSFGAPASMTEYLEVRTLMTLITLITLTTLTT